MKLKRLGEIAEFEGGSQPPKSNFIYEKRKGYVRFLQIRDFRSSKNLTYIPIDPKNRICVKSDILIGRYGASVGKILSGLEGAYNVALMKVIPKSEIVNRDFLYYYLLSNAFQEKLLNISDRSAQNGFSKEDIGSFYVALPTLEKQGEIVEKLDSAFAEIDLIEENLALNSEYIMEIEASLVANLWIKYANQLTIKRLDEVADYKNGSAHEKIVVENGKFVIINSKFISSNGLKFKRSSKQLAPLKVGDVTMVLSDVPNGKALAKCFLVDKDDTYTLNQRICKLTSTLLLPEFLALNINRNPYLLSFNNGENQTNLRLNDVLKTPIYVSDEKTQRIIIDEFVEAKNTIVGYSAMNRRKAESIILLKQSLLNSIFCDQESEVA